MNQRLIIIALCLVIVVALVLIVSGCQVPLRTVT